MIQDVITMRAKAQAQKNGKVYIEQNSKEVEVPVTVEVYAPGNIKMAMSNVRYRNLKAVGVSLRGRYE